MAVRTNGISRFPLDFGDLQKGDYLDSSILSEITGADPGTRAYRFRLLALQGKIIKETGFTAKIEDDGESIRILTDSEAAIHNNNWFHRARRAMFSRFELMQNVDSSNLTESEAQNFERNLLNQGKYIQALVTARHKKVLMPSSSKKQLSD